jgi:AcrR family transcriptional regulator
MTELLSERRRRLMRDELGRIAIRLFAERGFDNVTVDEIAAAAGTSPRTFFRYFSTKDEIVLDYERRLQERLLDALRSRPPAEGPVKALRCAYVATSHVEPADRQRVLQLGRILEAAPALRARANGERMGEDRAVGQHIAQRLGAHPDDARVRVIVTAMGAVAATEFQAWVDGGGKGDPAERISESLTVLEGGLAQLDRIASAKATKRR